MSDYTVHGVSADGTTCYEDRGNFEACDEELEFWDSSNIHCVRHAFCSKSNIESALTVSCYV